MEEHQEDNTVRCENSFFPMRYHSVQYFSCTYCSKFPITGFVFIRQKVKDFTLRVKTMYFWLSCRKDSDWLFLYSGHPFYREKYYKCLISLKPTLDFHLTDIVCNFTNATRIVIGTRCAVTFHNSTIELRASFLRICRIHNLFPLPLFYRTTNFVQRKQSWIWNTCYVAKIVLKIFYLKCLTSHIKTQWVITIHW